MSFPFKLSEFQIQSIEAIKRGENVLVTAHTGSGKSVPFEFAVEWYSQKQERNKLIYCSPIKALSNQKYYEMTKKFPGLRIGILTGDIKVNTDADILIMTTEILHNMLFSPSCANSFEMNIERDLACVVFDELHYINDRDRGHIWENTIIKLPLQVQLIMLSATLNDPMSFADWIMSNKPGIPICVSGTTERTVPLMHYTFLTSSQKLFKSIKKDDVLTKKVTDQIDKPKILQTKNSFNELEYHKMNSIHSLLREKDVRITRQHTLNTVTEYLKEQELFPAICFLLSRKQLVSAAKEVTTVLLEDDSKVPYIARRECEKMIRKLPNFEEYLSLPEYEEVVRLLEKGIGIHHAGMMPVLREMVEMCLNEGFIKLLFATETFALGVNFPIKTVLFTDITKFDGTQRRILHSHEYTQMAGRAGRRGLDLVGHVIHLNNLFNPLDLTDYRNMMGGKSQTFVSKFKITPLLLLGLVNVGDFQFVDFCKKSMIQSVIERDVINYSEEIKKLSSSSGVFQTPIEILEKYIQLIETKKTSGNKKKREAIKEIDQIVEAYPRIDRELTAFSLYMKNRENISIISDEIARANSYIETTVHSHFRMLVERGYLLEEPTTQTTALGRVALQFKEVDGMLFSLLYSTRLFDTIDSATLVEFLSCFSSVSVAEDDKRLSAPTGELYAFLEKYKKEDDDEIEIQYDLVDYMREWISAPDQESCKLVLQKMEKDKGIYLGEFDKGMLKICNIAREMEKVCEITDNLPLLSLLKTIPSLLLKFVVNNQSLYV